VLFNPSSRFQLSIGVLIFDFDAQEYPDIFKSDLVIFCDHHQQYELVCRFDIYITFDAIPSCTELIFSKLSSSSFLKNKKDEQEFHVEITKYAVYLSGLISKHKKNVLS